MKNAFLTFLALVFLVSFCWALPEAPKNMSGQVVSDGFLLSWEHPGGENVYFHVYRGETKADAELIASTSEKIFLDQLLFHQARNKSKVRGCFQTIRTTAL